MLKFGLILTIVLLLAQVVVSSNETNLTTSEVGNDTSTEIQYEDLGRKLYRPRGCSCLRWTHWVNFGKPQNLYTSPGYSKEALKYSPHYGKEQSEDVCQSPVSVGCRILVRTLDKEYSSSKYSACPVLHHQEAPRDGLVQLRYLCPDYMCPCLQWSDWYDNDDPDGEGDIETLLDTIPKQEWPCENGERPLDVDCRTVSGKRISHTKNKDVTCDLNGVKCYNREQGHRCTCEDYKVRFLCFRPSAPTHRDSHLYHRETYTTQRPYQPKAPKPVYEDTDKVLTDELVVPINKGSYEEEQEHRELPRKPHVDTYSHPKPKPRPRRPQDPEYEVITDDIEPFPEGINYPIGDPEPAPHSRPKPRPHRPRKPDYVDGEETITDEIVPPPYDDGYDQIDVPERMDYEVIKGGDGIIEKGPYDIPPPDDPDTLDPIYDLKKSYSKPNGPRRPSKDPVIGADVDAIAGKDHGHRSRGKVVDADVDAVEDEDVLGGLVGGKGPRTGGKPGEDYGTPHGYHKEKGHKLPGKSTLVGGDVDAIVENDGDRPEGELVDVDATALKEDELGGLLGGGKDNKEEYGSEGRGGHYEHKVDGHNEDKYSKHGEGHGKPGYKDTVIGADVDEITGEDKVSIPGVDGVVGNKPRIHEHYDKDGKRLPGHVISDPYLYTDGPNPGDKLPKDPKTLVGADVDALAEKDGKRTSGEVIDADVDALNKDKDLLGSLPLGKDEDLELAPVPVLPEGPDYGPDPEVLSSGGNYEKPSLPEREALPDLPAGKDSGVAADLVGLSSKEKKEDYGSVADLEVASLADKTGKRPKTPVGLLGRSGSASAVHPQDEPMARMTKGKSSTDCETIKLMYAIFSFQLTAKGSEHLYKLQQDECND